MGKIYRWEVGKSAINPFIDLELRSRSRLDLETKCCVIVIVHSDQVDGIRRGGAADVALTCAWVAPGGNSCKS